MSNNVACRSEWKGSVLIGDDMNKKRLYRNDQNVMISGVCSGFADYTGLDVGLVRVLTALITVFSFSTMIIVYLIFALVLPTKTQLEREGYVVGDDKQFKKKEDINEDDEYAFNEDDYKW